MNRGQRIVVVLAVSVAIFLWAKVYIFPDMCINTFCEHRETTITRELSLVFGGAAIALIILREPPKKDESPDASEGPIQN